MAYGIQLFNDDGSLQWDSSTTGSGVIVDVIDIPANTGPIVKTYPFFVGRSLVAIGLSLGTKTESAVSNYTIDYDLGYPRITFPVIIYTRNRTVLIIR